MTQFSMLPWTTGVSGDGAAPYTQENSNNFFRFFDVRDPAVEGVVLGVLSELAVSGSASPLTVASGAAVCYGRYWNDTNVNLAVSTPTSGTTGGRVVLRCSWSSRQIRLAVKTSPNGVGSIPSLTQVFGNTWEISLATFTITTGGVIALTDDRTFRKATFQIDAAALVDGAVTTAKVANSGITTAKLADGAVTEGKLADGSVANAKLASGSVSTDKIAADAVDDTKAGARLLQMYRRQGGSATSWTSQGSTNYTPGAVRMQVGSIPWSSAGAATGSVAVTFPVAFSQIPLIFIVATETVPGGRTVATYYNATNGAGFTINFIADVSAFSIIFNWLAIGPE